MRRESRKTFARINDRSQQYDPEPGGPILIATLAVVALHTALPAELTIGSRWIFPSIVLTLLISSGVARRARRHRLHNILGFAVDGVLTLRLIISLGLLIAALPTQKETPQRLLLSAACLWITNILVFALWYWRMDRRAGQANSTFLFPQMTMSKEALGEAGQQDWSPQFADYLFLAFNTNTALSPTDTPVLTRWGKALMMSQSLISLLIIALLAARAVNIL